jgi:hypothetical protein
MTVRIISQSPPPFRGMENQPLERSDWADAPLVARMPRGAEGERWNRQHT